MAQKYLDYTGVQTLVDNIKNKSIPLSQKGVANGVATLDGTGKVPTSQLPSYVDDVLEFDNYSSFPIEGEKGKLYIDISTTPSSVYRWTGTTYLQITGIIGAQGETGLQGITGPQGPSHFDNRFISVTLPTSSNNNTLILATRGNVRGYKYISLDNAINPTRLVVNMDNGSNDIEHVVLLKNNTTSEFSFNSLNDFIFEYNNTSCPGLYPNDLQYFFLRIGEAVEISFMYNSRFGGIIVSLGNIYKSST